MCNNLATGEMYESVFTKRYILILYEDSKWDSPTLNSNKCLKKYIRECEWKEFCDDIDGARKPMIVDKSLIESGSCPRTGTNMEDVEIEEVERSREDKCEDCPYCNSRGVSFLIEVKKI